MRGSWSSNWRPCVQPATLHLQPGLPPSTRCCSLPGSRSCKWLVLVLDVHCSSINAVPYRVGDEAVNCGLVPDTSATCKYHPCCFRLHCPTLQHIGHVWTDGMYTSLPHSTNSGHAFVCYLTGIHMKHVLSTCAPSHGYTVQLVQHSW